MSALWHKRASKLELPTWSGCPRQVVHGPERPNPVRPGHLVQDWALQALGMPAQFSPLAETSPEQSQDCSSICKKLRVSPLIETAPRSLGCISLSKSHQGFRMCRDVCGKPGRHSQGLRGIFLHRNSLGMQYQALQASREHITHCPTASVGEVHFPWKKETSCAEACRTDPLHLVMFLEQVKIISQYLNPALWRTKLSQF